MGLKEVNETNLHRDTMQCANDATFLVSPIITFTLCSKQEEKIGERVAISQANTFCFPLIIVKCAIIYILGC